MEHGIQKEQITLNYLYMVYYRETALFDYLLHILAVLENDYIQHPITTFDQYNTYVSRVQQIKLKGLKIKEKIYHKKS